MKNQLALLFFFISFGSLSYSEAGWSKLSVPSLSFAGRFLCFDKSIIAAADSGIYISTDSGSNWAFASIDDPFINPDSSIVQITATMFSRNDRLIFASTNIGVYASEDTGKTWEPMGPLADGHGLYLISIFTKGSYVFTTMAGGGVFRSSDNGMTWSFIGAHRFYKYMDFQDKLFAAAMDGLWFSDDLGMTWKLCKEFDIWPKYISVYSLAHNDKYLFLDCWDNIYRSSDAGMTIQAINNGLPFPQYKICDIFAYNNFVFAGMKDKKIYFSKNEGEYWEEISDGLDTVDFVSCFGISNERLLISSNRNLWSYELSQLTGAIQDQPRNPGNICLYQNYPNPFNPVTNISYSISDGKILKLAVYNLLGKELDILVNRYVEPGRHTIQFDASSLPSGIYIYKIQASGFSNSRKLMILK